MKFTLLILLFAINVAMAQPLHLQGNITDAQTGKPVAAATISISAKNFFFPADDLGRFSIDDARVGADDSIAISCIGYQTQTLPVKAIQANGSVRLMAFVTHLHEVLVGYHKPQLVKVGSAARSGFGVASFLPGMQQAMFMSGSANTPGIIQTVGFYLKKGNLLVKDKGDVTAPFRVRLYGVNPDGSPGAELSNQLVIVSAKKNNEWFDVDLSPYQIENPEHGFFVAFCLLNRDFYLVNDRYKNNLDMLRSSASLLTPRLSFTNEVLKIPISYRGVNTNHGIKWMVDQNNYLIRASLAAN